jgi:integrase
VLTAARSGEVRLATWSEIDTATSTWFIPAARMKARRNHRVPLSPAALDVLRDAERLLQRPQSPTLIFPGARGRPLLNAISTLLKDRAISAVPHGFRSSFRDWAAEQTAHPREVIEAALAHRVRNQTEAAYARSDLFDRRRQLMHDWASYLYGNGRTPTESTSPGPRQHSQNTN